MRVLVTGGAGFIGSHFAKRLAGSGRRGRRPRQADLLRATRRTSRASTSSSSTATSATRRRSPSAAAGCDAIVNFAAETHVDRSILGAAEFIETDVLGTYVLLDLRPRGRDPARPGLDRRGVRRRPGGRARARTTRCARRARTARRRPAATCRCSPPSAPTASTPAITRGSNTYGPNQYPEKLIPLFVTNALDGEPLPVYGDGRQRRDWLHVDDHCAAIELVLREGAAGEVYNVGGEELENIELTAPDPRADRRRRGARSATSTTGPATTAATRSTTRSSARSAGAPEHSIGERPGRDRRLVPRQPRLVGADQVRRVPRVLRAAVRGAAPLARSFFPWPSWPPWPPWPCLAVVVLLGLVLLLRLVLLLGGRGERRDRLGRERRRHGHRPDDRDGRRRRRGSARADRGQERRRHAGDGEQPGRHRQRSPVRSPRPGAPITTVGGSPPAWAARSAAASSPAEA